MGKYDEIIKQMTLEEKASLLSGETSWLTKPVERLNVPQVWVADGPHGLRKEDKTSGGTNIMAPSTPATCFPTAVTTASSWDRNLMFEVGKAIAEEAKNYEVTTVLGPGINIKRSPLCGRNFEYISEDPYHTGEMASSFVDGIQSTGVGTSLKHYAANNQEYIRMTIESIVDERALREIYLAGFEKVVKKSQPATIMCSYNKLNGEYLSDNKYMLTDVLRGEWGFEGVVVSDWGAVNDRVKGVKAGMDLEMPANGGLNDRRVIKAVKEGKLTEAEVDILVERLLNFVYTTKKAEDPAYKCDFEKNHKLARKAAAESAVLLKNNGALPLAKGEKIAVIGKLADQPRYQGSGSSKINSYKLVSFKEALDKEKIPYAYAEGYTFDGDGFDEDLLKEAVELAKTNDKVIVFAGLTDLYESEGFDRDDMEMPEGHKKLVNALSKVNDNVIVALVCGSPVAINFMPKINAMVNFYLGGDASGEAALDVLYGKVCPSGKLAETFPIANEDNIAAKYFGMGPRTVEYRESIFVGYRYFDKVEKPVLFPFGFGLSYTTFEYSDLKLDKTDLTQGDSLNVSFKVKNTGSVDGAEIAQVYVSDVESTIFMPEKELKGFEKVFLKAGEEKEVTITLDQRAFEFYNTAISDWHTESGEFKILVGASSRDIKFESIVNVTSKNPNAPIPDYTKTAPVYYDIKNAKEIPDAQFEALYGDKLVANTPFKQGEFTLNSTVQDIKDTRIGKFIRRIVKIGAKILMKDAVNFNMIIRTADYIPLRAVEGFGVFSPMSMQGIVDMANGVKGGMRKFFRGMRKKNKE